MQLVDHIKLDEGCVRYETGKAFYSKAERKHHYHGLIGKTCGKILPFKDNLLDEPECLIEEKVKFHALEHKLNFYVQCQECCKEAN